MRALPPRRQTGAVLVWIAGVLVAAAALVGLYFVVVLSWSYSSGERAGWVQKLSKKGWLCKTWEGELSMVAMPGAMPEKFSFTVREDAVAESINREMGRRVSLHYEEKVGLPTTCFGDTRYFVTRVVPVAETPPVPTTPAAAPAPQPAPAAAGAAGRPAEGAVSR